jgi:hypothetical protein
MRSSASSNVKRGWKSNIGPIWPKGRAASSLPLRTGRRGNLPRELVMDGAWRRHIGFIGQGRKIVTA